VLAAHRQREEPLDPALERPKRLERSGEVGGTVALVRAHIIPFRCPHSGGCSAVVTALFREPGDELTRGDLLLEVDSGKAIMGLEVWVTGRLDELFVAVGSELDPGDPVGVVLIA